MYFLAKERPIRQHSCRDDAREDLVKAESNWIARRGEDHRDFLMSASWDPEEQTLVAT